jgi:hypothetical protein
MSNTRYLRDFDATGDPKEEGDEEDDGLLAINDQGEV